MAQVPSSRLCPLLSSALLGALLLLASSAAEPVASDPEGDVVHRTLLADVEGGPPAADLLALDVAARGDGLDLTAAHAGDPGDPSSLGGVETTLSFRFGALRYAVVAGEGVVLWATDESGEPQRRVADLEGGRDGPSLRFRLPYEVVRDEAGAPLAPDRALEDIVVTTSSREAVEGPDPERGFFCCTTWWTAHDRMPDEGAVTYRIPGQTGAGLILSSATPFRASNGGPDRFVFTLAAENQGPAAVSARLVLDGVPPDWTVTAPDGTLRLAPGGTASFPVVLETAGRHRHGGAEAFTIRLAGDATAEARLGVHYLDVAQPGGHHRNLYFHNAALEGGVIEQAGYAPGRLWMNTLAEDPADDGAPVDSTTSSFGGEEARWSLCLAEGLRLGLAQRTDAAGLLETTFSSGRPYGPVRLEGTLYHYGPGPAVGACDAAAYRAQRNETVVARIGPTEAQEVDGPTRFAADAVPAIDRLRHEPGAALVLELVARFGTPDTQAPGPLVLEPGGRLMLPLEDHQDDASPHVPSWAAAAPPPSEAGGKAAPHDEGRPARSTPVGHAPVGLAAAALAIAATRRRRA